MNEKRGIEVYEIFSKTIMIPLDKAKEGGRAKTKAGKQERGNTKISHAFFFPEEKTDKRADVTDRFLSNPSMAFSSDIKVHVLIIQDCLRALSRGSYM